MALDKLKEDKGKHNKQQAEENDVTYSQLAKDVEKTRGMVRNLVSRAFTVSDFAAIKEKMDKIDQRLDDLYNNWHAEYGSAATLEECEEIKRFYKSYLEKYESNKESYIKYCYNSQV